MIGPQHTVAAPAGLWLRRRNRQGYVIPFFVADQSGAHPDFRAPGRDAFVIGPMCAINRVSADPPSHQECAEYSVRVCPFLLRPQMRRREQGLPPLEEATAGIALARNPGVALIWTTARWHLEKVEGGWLFDFIGEPSAVSWWSQGRPATRSEVLASVDSGMPQLRALCEDAQDHADLDGRYQRALALLPPE